MSAAAAEDRTPAPVPASQLRVAQAARTREVAFDWMRGLVMVLMTVDHASLFWNPARLAKDSAADYAGQPLDSGQFFLRWITHLCAPTFLFLAGTALALSVARREAAGQRAWTIDRDLLIRGAFIVLLDVVWISTLAGMHMFQVLYAIGAAMITMVALRRVPVRVIVALALAWVALGELVTLAVWDPTAPPDSVALGLVVSHYTKPPWMAFYPLVPWLALMALGWGFGVYYRTRGAAKTMRLALYAGLAALAVFAVVRGVNGYGNMALARVDGSIEQWLHVSKYPPSLSYVALELGLALSITAGLMALAARVKRPWDGNPILVFGQTALFFYVLHQALLLAIGKVLGLERSLTTVALTFVIALALLYPLCWLYRRAKRRYPESALKYL